MNRQINYIIQGFLLALLIPISGFIVKKISSTISVSQNTSAIIDDDVNLRSDALIVAASKGKMLFFQRCASCHHVLKDGTGPALMGFEERGPWADRKNLYKWIRNPSEFLRKNSYTKALKEKYGSVMTAFPDITDEEVDHIVEFINDYAN